MHILKSLLLLSFLFSQNSHGLTAQEVLLLSPKDIFTKPALLKGGFLDEKKFAFFSSEPPNMDSDPNRPVLTLTINNPTTDKLIDTLVIIDNNYEQPIGKNPVNKNKFEAFLTKHSIKLENLNSKLMTSPPPSLVLCIQLI